MSRTALMLALFAVGCGSQAGIDYSGQALASISGTVQNGNTPIATTSIDAAVVWAQANFAPNQQFVQSLTWVGESTPVTGTFPASFTLSIYQPPPESVLIACPASTAHVAVGFVVAVDASAIGNGGDVGAAVVGLAPQSMLLYLDSDQPAGWSCAPDFGFTFAPTKGFHLLNQVPNSLQPRYAGAEYPAYTEAPAGLTTPLMVTLGTSPFFGSGGQSCYTPCKAKASTCGAPASAADSVCAQFCGANPSQTQQACLQASSCAALTQAFASGSLCGVALGAASSP